MCDIAAGNILFEKTSMFVLNDGQVMPRLGFGTSGVWDDQAPRIIGEAFDAGFRLIDTAACYRNERGVGRAVRTAAETGLSIFVTTKVWNSDHGFDKTLWACEASLRRLGLDAIDLYLIHWPIPAQNRYLDSWRALVRLRAEGRVRSIGVSNFNVPHLQYLIDETGVVPAVNQIEVHPCFQQCALRDFHRRLGIATQAWSPLGAGTSLSNPVVAAIAAKHRCSPAQVVLNWHLTVGNLPIPKSVSTARIRDNADALHVDLDIEDLVALSRLSDPDGRIGPDPEHLDLEGTGIRWKRRIVSLAANPSDAYRRFHRIITR